jgi:Cytochrome c554 and c-prime
MSLVKWVKELGRAACVMALAFVCGFGGQAVAEPADPHLAVFDSNNYPSAVECGRCHQKIFQEWSSSNHAYASISPMFHKFEQTINRLSVGTIDAFCVRCHQQVGTQLGEAREKPLWERSPIAREGITCITCHRVSQEFGKVNGERHIDPAPINAPVYNTGTGENLETVLNDPQRFGVSTKPGDPGTPIHAGVIKFEQIGKSEFCVSCHQVAVNIGIKLEVVWDQYRDSPAFRAGVTCQDCHMGKVPGEAKGFEPWPIAIVGGQVVGSSEAKHSNHAFFGPGYPIAHPGLFPFNPQALDWSIKDWLKFDYTKDWGKAEFEDALAAGLVTEAFPEEWSDRRAREKARYIIEQNTLLLDDKREDRRAVMQNGIRLDGPFFGNEELVSGKPLSVRYTVTNVDPGHNAPSGSLGAQPEIWLNVALIDPDGNNVWESGYVDSHGDMADLHSLDVRAGKLEHDDQLFNLQTKFLTTNVKGTDREMYLPVNIDVDQIPFLRPASVPTTVLNHPPLIRMEGRSIPPLGNRQVRYKIPAEALQKPGKYTLQSRMRSRAEPMYFMKFVGSTPSMEQRMNEWILDFNVQATEFDVGSKQ